MTTQRIDGKALAQRIKDETAERLRAHEGKVGLAIVQVGDRPESTLYVRLKKKAAEELGMRFEHKVFSVETPENEVLQYIGSLNKRPDIHGIVVQLPLPETMSTPRILSAVAISKDVDGLHPSFQAKIRQAKKTAWLPALQASMLALLDAGKISLKEKQALVCAKSEEFRATTRAVLAARGAVVTTVATLEETRSRLATADIVVTALGAPHAITEDMCKAGAVLLDIGLTTTENGVAGDFAGTTDQNRLATYSPVPGGVGPVTVAQLVANTAIAAGSTRRSLTSVRISPEIVLWVIAALMFVVAPFFFGGAGPWGRATLLWGTSLILLLASMLGIQRSTQRWWLRWETIFGTLFLFAASSLMWSAAPKKSLEELVMLFAGGALFLCARSLSSKNARTWFFSALIAGGSGLAGYGLWTFVTNHYGLRIPGSYLNPDGFAAAMILPTLLATGFVRVTQGWRRVLALGALMLTGTTLLLTTSIPILAALVVAGVLWMIVRRPRMHRRTIGAALAVIVILSAATVAIRLAVSRSNSLTANSATTTIVGLSSAGARGSFDQRISFLRSSLDMALARPLSGVGFGLWSDYFPQYPRSVLERTELAHSTPAHYLSELGFPGFLLFLGLLVWMAVSLVRRSQDDTPLTSAARLGTLALLGAACIDVSWFYPALFLLFWFVAGTLQQSTPRPPVSGKVLRGVLILFGLGLLVWSSARFLTSYWTVAADASAQGQRDRIDALATAELAMGLVPTPAEELKLSVIQWVFSYYEDDKTRLRTWAEQTLRDNPQQPASYLLLGRIEARDGNTARAEELFRSGLALDPYFVPDLAGDLVELYVKAQRTEEALQLAATQLERTGYGVPDRERSLARISVFQAQAELQLDHPQEAHDALLRALEYVPGYEDARTLLKDVFNEDR